MRLYNILITGGAGFIGSEFVRKIVKLNKYSKIYILDNLTYASDLSRIQMELALSNVELIVSDVKDTDNYARLLKEIKVIVHFAAESHVDNSITNSEPFLQTNVIGSSRLINAARLHSRARVVLISTDEVYGSIIGGEFSENARLSPSSPYSASKSAADLLALAQYKTFGQDIIITRSCNNYGPMQNQEKFIPNSILKILSNCPVSIYGDGLNTREWIHVSDHVEAIINIIDKGKKGEIYNIGTNERKTNLEIVNLLFDAFNKTRSIEFVDDRLGHDFRYAINSDKIREEFKWRPKINLKQGLQELVNFSKNELN